MTLARPINIPAQPESPYADTEVSTNIAIHPSRTDVRDVKLHMQLAGTADNNLMVLDSNPALANFAATCGGETAFAAFATAPPPAWFFKNNWKLMRVVRRGATAPGEWARCEVCYNFFVIKLR